jgi:lipopolysaccharide transport system permease protein
MKKNSSQEIKYEIKPKVKFDMGLGELWESRELFYFFTWRDIRVKYKQTFLGFTWAILQPLLMTLVFSLAFSNYNSNQNIPYPLYVCSGFILWNLFASGVSNAGNSMVSNSNIIKKIYFPRLIIPISSVLVAFFDFLMTLPLLIIFLFYYKVAPSLANIWMFPAGICMALISTLGPSCLLAALNVKYRDFRYVIPFLVQFLMFVTLFIQPSVYSNSVVLRYLLSVNPMAGAVALFRGFITGQQVDVLSCSISCISAFVFFLLGVYVFRKTESYFADLA